MAKRRKKIYVYIPVVDADIGSAYTSEALALGAMHQKCEKLFKKRKYLEAYRGDPRFAYVMRLELL